MNKAELVAAVAEKAEISKKDAEAAVKAFTDVIAEELKKGEILYYIIVIKIGGIYYVKIIS